MCARTQEVELGFEFDYIVICPVRGSTQAGMVVGFAADARADRVIGIDASATPNKTKAQILRIAQNTAALVKLGREIIDRVVFKAPNWTSWSLRADSGNESGKSIRQERVFR
jgi:1-aminocyclopropane-1-carboxylate deaminase